MANNNYRPHIEYLTDEEWYNFICGMIAGLQVKDNSLPEVQEEVTYEPIGVGGWGTIGQAIQKTVYEEGGDTEGSLAVYLHDADRMVSDFTCRIKYDPSRVNVTEIVEGDYGTLDEATVDNGIIYVRGIKGSWEHELAEQPETVGEGTILFYINISLIDTNITADNPIEFEFLVPSFTDVNNTTLIEYVQLQNQLWYTYLITPTLNVKGGVYTDIEAEVEVIDEVQVLAPHSIDGVYAHSKCIEPGVLGASAFSFVNRHYRTFQINEIYFKVMMSGDTHRIGRLLWRDHLYYQAEQVALDFNEACVDILTGGVIDQMVERGVQNGDMYYQFRITRPGYSFDDYNFFGYIMWLMNGSTSYDIVVDVYDVHFVDANGNELDANDPVEE